MTVAITDVARMVWTEEIISGGLPAGYIGRWRFIEAAEGRWLYGESWDRQFIYYRIDLDPFPSDVGELVRALDREINRGRQVCFALAVWPHLRNTDPYPLPGCYE